MFEPETPLPHGLRIALLWLFAILNMLFRDVHELTTASAVNEILAGQMNGMPVTEGLLVVGAFLVELLLIAFLGSAVLGRNGVRGLNFVIVPLAILGTVAARPSDPDDFFFAAIEIITFCVIFRLVWNWKPVATSATKSAVAP